MSEATGALLSLHRTLGRITAGIGAGVPGYDTLDRLSDTCHKRLEEACTSGDLIRSVRSLARSKDLHHVYIRFRSFFGKPRSLVIALEQKEISELPLDGDPLFEVGFRSPTDKVMLVAHRGLDETSAPPDCVVAAVYDDSLRRALSAAIQAADHAGLLSADRIEQHGADVPSLERLKNNLLAFAGMLAPVEAEPCSHRLMTAIARRVAETAVEQGAATQGTPLPADYDYFFQIVHGSEVSAVFTFACGKLLSNAELDRVRTAAAMIADHLTLVVRGTLYAHTGKRFSEVHGDWLLRELSCGTCDPNALSCPRAHAILTDHFPFIQEVVGDVQIAREIFRVVLRLAQQDCLDIPGCQYDLGAGRPPSDHEPLARILYYAIDFEDRLKIIPGY